MIIVAHAVVYVRARAEIPSILVRVSAIIYSTKYRYREITRWPALQPITHFRNAIRSVLLRVPRDVFAFAIFVVQFCRDSR